VWVVGGKAALPKVTAGLDRLLNASGCSQGMSIAAAAEPPEVKLTLTGGYAVSCLTAGLQAAEHAELLAG